MVEILHKIFTNDIFKHIFLTQNMLVKNNYRR